MSSDRSGHDQNMAPAEQPTDAQAPTSGTPSSRASSSRSSASSLSRSSANSSITGSGTRSPGGSSAGSAPRRHSHSGPSRTLTRPSRVDRTHRRPSDTIPGPNGTEGPPQRRLSISEMMGRSNIDQRPHHMLPPRPSSRGGFLPSPLSAVTTSVDTEMGAHTTSPTSDQREAPSTHARMPRAHAPSLSTQSLESGSGTSIPSGTPRQYQQGIARPGSAVFGVPRGRGLDMEARTLDRVFETLRSEPAGEGEHTDDLTGAVQSWWTVSSSRYQMARTRSNPPVDHASVVSYFRSKRNDLMIFFCQVAEELVALSDAPSSTPEAIALLTAQQAVDRSADSVLRTRFLQGSLPDLSRDP